MRHLKHNPALDGIRALAVFAVFCQHIAALAGGYLGVDIFFVLSGFLITGLLLQEIDDTGSVSIKAFYVRRAFRLLPAFYIYTAVGLALVLLTKGARQQHEFLRNALSALLYVNNYDRAFFNPAGGGSWFGHVWSLSLEEQFYLVWPACLLVVCRSQRLRRHLALVLFGGAWAVFLWREAEIALGASHLRIYFGLDTRADALLVGCTLAALRHDGFRFSLRRDTPGRAEAAQLPSWLAVAGPLAFVALTIIAVDAPALNSGINWLDRGGYTLVAVLAGLVVISVDGSRSDWWSRLLGSRPLAGLGRISYAFYLWHFPVAALVPRFVGRFGAPVATLGALLVSGLLAALSTRFVELPLQRRRPVWANAKQRQMQPPPELPAPDLRAA
jgi:peptidoglycan/LPS O-acetylase OafA/YrhL